MKTEQEKKKKEEKNTRNIYLMLKRQSRQSKRKNFPKKTRKINLIYFLFFKKHVNKLGKKKLIDNQKFNKN